MKQWNLSTKVIYTYIILLRSSQVYHYRYIISRWRLSCHDLKIETGGYAKPAIPRETRLCDVCYEIEDEFHAIFICPRYNTIREKYSITEQYNMQVFESDNT